MHCSFIVYLFLWKNLQWLGIIAYFLSHSILFEKTIGLVEVVFVIYSFNSRLNCVVEDPYWSVCINQIVL